MRFTADGALRYVLDGAHAFAGSTGTARYRITLFDRTTATYAFESCQRSNDVVGASFVAGGTAGATTNVLTGTRTGTLVDGHDYVFLVFGEVANRPDNLNALTGSATGRLTLGAPVPEPTTLALFGLGPPAWPCAAVAPSHSAAARADDRQGHRLRLVKWCDS